jgi:hypothetical protein
MTLSLRLCKRCTGLAGYPVYKPADQFGRESKGIQDGRQKRRFCRDCKQCEKLRLVELCKRPKRLTGNAVRLRLLRAVRESSSVM